MGTVEKWVKMGTESYKIEKIDKDSTALLIIDTQNDFLHDDGYLGKVLQKEIGFNLRIRREMIPQIKRLAEAMREVGAPVIYCQTVLEPDYADLGIPIDELHLPRARELKFMVKGTWGSQIVEELTPQRGDYVVDAKCWSKFRYTPLELILRNKGIKTLIFTGGGTNGCVESTLRAATELRFQTITASDATRAGTPEWHEAGLKSIAFFFGAVMTCDEIIELLRKD